MHTVYLALGTNLGDRKQNLQTVIARLSDNVKMQACSSLYDTAPMGNIHQPRFLNMVCQGNTGLSPQELLKFAKEIESQMGRKPGPLNSPRPIDIDILFYDNRIIESPLLVIPHPRLAERVFVLLPLLEIAPALKHPVNGKTVREMLHDLQWGAADITKWEG